MDGKDKKLFHFVFCLQRYPGIYDYIYALLRSTVEKSIYEKNITTNTLTDWLGIIAGSLLHKWRNLGKAYDISLCATILRPISNVEDEMFNGDDNALKM